MDIFGAKWSNHWEKILNNTNAILTDDDILLIAGDLCWAMKLDGAENELKALSLLKGKKVLVKGNHDFWWSSLSKARSLISSDISLIQCNAIKLDNYIFVGSRGWDIVKEDDAEQYKIYHREFLRLEQSLKVMEKLKCEEDKVIGMMHFPPFGPGFTSSLFTELFESYGVKKVIYGHIHAKDADNMPKVIRLNGVEYYLTSCDALDFCPVRIE